MRVKQIVEANWLSQKEFISKLKIRKKLNEYAKTNDITKLYNLVHQNYDPVFVLSTGRCGTAFLTKILNLEKSIAAFHEPEPEFFYHTLMAFDEFNSNPIKVSAVFDVARYELIRNIFISDKKYVETNNRITFFAHQIALLYPQSKFIHLVRNPKSFIKSGLSRNWYSNHSLYDEGRVVLKDTSWNTLSQIEKIGWLWNETNQFIEDFKIKQSSSRILTVKAEDIFNDLKSQKNIFDFIGLKSPSDSSLKKFNTKVNEGGKIALTYEQETKIISCVNQFSLRKKYGY